MARKLREIFILSVTISIFLSIAVFSKPSEALTYSFFNLTNYTTGEPIANGQNYSRSQLINVSALWDDGISSAEIEHNGTGVWKNYTITPVGNWTNYTLVLSNSAEFNAKTIAINAIYVNDTLSNSSNTFTLLYFYLDREPSINQFYFLSTGGLTNNYNKYDGLLIFSTIQDDFDLNNVTAEIKYPSPNGTSFIVNMSGDLSAGEHEFNYSIGSPIQLDIVGTFNVTINATDIRNQSTFSSQNFYVFDNYTIDTSSLHDIYNRGENVTFNALDKHLEQVSNATWIVNLTKINETQNFTYSNVTVYNYTIQLNDTEGNYSIFVNASKNENSGNYTWPFNVSSNLTLLISTDASPVSKNTPVTVSAALYNARGEFYNISTLGNITCNNIIGLINFSYGVANTTCISPDSHSTTFNISVNVTDLYNNTGENFTTLTTVNPPPANTGSPGSSGPSSSSSPIKNCTDGTVYDQCNASKRPIYCSNGKLVENCTICGCMPGYSCQTNGSCKITALENFSFATDVESIEIIRGEDGKAIISLSNTGNTPLNLITETESDCCNVTLDTNISLNKSEDRDIPLLIHVPLFVNPGEYILKIKIGKELIKKEKSIKVFVTETPYHDSLEEIKTAIGQLENEVTEYKKSGIDVTSLIGIIQDSKTLLQSIDNQISADNLNSLKDSVLKLEKNVNSATSYVLVLRTQKVLLDNKFLIIALIAMIIITVYFVPEVLMPLQKVEVEIKKLRNDEKVLVDSRVETEKQYFMRKIDENTFSKIMITKQDNILKLRSTTHEKEIERKKILSKAHPKEMVKWFGRSIKNLPKNMKNIFERIRKRNKNNNPNK